MKAASNDKSSGFSNAAMTARHGCIFTSATRLSNSGLDLNKPVARCGGTATMNEIR
jgi:hypothetical protein